MSDPKPAATRSHLWEQEPFATFRNHPRRFGWGIPAVFLLSIGAGTALASRSLTLAIAVQLGLQTIGLLWLYLPVARWRSPHVEGEADGSGLEER